jgi:hypothetical protein
MEEIYLHNLSKKLNEIMVLINNQNDKIDEIMIRLEKLESYGNRMDNHISFIEYTYQSLVKPIEYIKYYFSDNKSIDN